MSTHGLLRRFPHSVILVPTVTSVGRDSGEGEGMRRNIAIVMGLVVLLAGCDYPFLIDTPHEGQIVETVTVPVSGNVNGLAPGGTLTVDGIPFAVNPDGTWNATIEVDADQWVTVFEVVYTDP